MVERYIVLVLPPSSMKLFVEIQIKIVDQERERKTHTKLCDGMPQVFLS